MISSSSDSEPEPPTKRKKRKKRQAVTDSADTNSSSDNDPKPPTKKKKRKKRQAISETVDTEDATNVEPTKKKKLTKKRKPKKRKQKSSSSDSDSCSSDSESSDSSNEENSSGDSSSEPATERKKGKKSSIYNPDNWKRLNKRWPIELRPDELLDKAYVNSMTVEALTTLCAFYNETDKVKRKVNVEVLSKDRKPRKKRFKAKSDDCKRTLHPARFLRWPISAPTKWWGANVPKRHKETYRSLPLEFTGTDRVISGKIIAQAHDRTTVLKIKHFASANVSISNRPMKEMRKQDNDGAVVITDFSWESPDTVVKIQEAFYNYLGLLHALWPFDCTAISMIKLMNRYRWLGASESLQARLAILSGFFDEVLENNAQRAVNEQCILSYQDQEEVLKNLMLRNGMRPEVPFLQQQQQHQRNQKANAGSGGNWNNYSIPKNQQKKPNQNQNQQNRQFGAPNLNGVVACRHYNDGNRCRNTLTQGGKRCKDSQGREFLHLCSAWSNSNNAWCMKPHRKPDHR